MYMYIPIFYLYSTLPLIRQARQGPAPTPTGGRRRDESWFLTGRQAIPSHPILSYPIRSWIKFRYFYRALGSWSCLMLIKVNRYMQMSACRGCEQICCAAGGCYMGQKTVLYGCAVMIARSKLFIICPYSPSFLCVWYWEGLYHNDRSRKYLSTVCPAGQGGITYLYIQWRWLLPASGSRTLWFSCGRAGRAAHINI